jgi:hypothetical protein
LQTSSSSAFPLFRKKIFPSCCWIYSSDQVCFASDPLMWTRAVCPGASFTCCCWSHRSWSSLPCVLWTLYYSSFVENKITELFIMMLRSTRDAAY